jgi:hypothetical protein
LFDAFSWREPESASLENAMVCGRPAKGAAGSKIMVLKAFFIPSTLGTKKALSFLF